MVSSEALRDIADQKMGEGGLFVYDLDEMAANAQALQAAKMPYGMTIRYAAKANPDPTIVGRFTDQGLSFDASSTPEAAHLLAAGVEGSKISLSSQVLRDTPDLRHALEEGVRPVVTSIRQIGLLAQVGANFGLENIALRANPGEGSGGNKRTTVGGPAAPFGIWKDLLPQALKAAANAGLTIDRIHTHIGSGVNSKEWQKTIQNSLAIVEECPDTVTTLDVGGGYKVARMPDESATNMDDVFGVFAEELKAFESRTGRAMHLEIEPGTWLVANAGVLLGRVEELAETPLYKQAKLNVGMNAVLRISHYGAQHPLEALNDSRETKEYAVFGPCCESGDILTPAKDNPEEIKPRELKKLEVEDYIAIGGSGAYCAFMSATNYNHVPGPTSVFIDRTLDRQG
jgi:diaminopimelate decarboxylase